MKLIIDIKLGPGRDTLQKILNLLEAEDPSRVLMLGDKLVFTELEPGSGAVVEVGAWEVRPEPHDYCRPVDEDGDLFSIEEFKEMVADHAIMDYDGHGYAVKDDLMSAYAVDLEDLPADATHVVWFNK